MAKKEQQKNSADYKSADAREKHQGTGHASCAASEGRKASEGRDFKDDYDFRRPLNEDVKNVISSADGKKRNKKNANSQRRVDVKHEVSESVLTNCNSSESSEAFVSRENETSDDHAKDSEKLNSKFGSTAKRLHPDAIAKNSQLYNVIGFGNLRSSLLWIWKKSYEWMETQKPLLGRVADHTRSAYDYLRLKYLHAYPVVLRWLGHFGNISLLLSIIWLNCFVRGMDSLLRMGTTSFFAILWFLVLSVIAMVGLMKFLILLVVAAVIGMFVGFIIALLIVISASAVFLWLYGSFWTTTMVGIFGGLSFALGCDRLALLVTTAYSMYCAWTYVGWLGIILGLNLSFFSSDALIYFLKRNMDEHRNMASEQAAGTQGREGLFTRTAYSDADAEQPGGCSAGVASTSGVDSEISSEDEVIRLLNCTDHYSAMGLFRYQKVDVSVLKREYRKKAMLVHPDKNMGNEKAAEAFKKLQNAYEVLLDSLKQKTYDDELRREELLNYFCQLPSVGQKKGRDGEAEGQDPLGEVRRIACKKCGGFHMWVQTKKSKSTARWCQDCKDFHQAKDGDGWVEQSSQPFLFGMLQKVDAPVAYVCADSKVYNATEWYICQGMRSPVNSHKPSFHVNTSVTKNHNPGRGNRPSQKGGMPPEDNMTEEEFFEWLQTAVNSGVFDNFAGSTSSDTTAASSRPNGTTNSGKKKKKGKKQW